MDQVVEHKLRQLIDARTYEDAATLALEHYGPGVYRFLLSRFHDPALAAEAFAQLGEDLWVGLPAFRGQSAFMTWMFTLARNAAFRIERSPHERADRRTTSEKLARVAAEVRERTAPHLRTDVKEEFRALRASLDADERALLHLRIDREMEWNDVARVIEGDETLDGEDLKRASMKMRKRFGELKTKLRELAREAGLLDR